MTAKIIELAGNILSRTEIALAERLRHLIDKGKMRQAWALLEQILPS